MNFNIDSIHQKDVTVDSVDEKEFVTYTRFQNLFILFLLVCNIPPGIADNSELLYKLGSNFSFRCFTLAPSKDLPPVAKVYWTKPKFILPKIKILTLYSVVLSLLAPPHFIVYRIAIAPNAIHIYSDPALALYFSRPPPI
jgi:hypothetical protein